MMLTMTMPSHPMQLHSPHVTNLSEESAYVKTFVDNRTVEMKIRHIAMACFNYISMLLIMAKRWVAFRVWRRAEYVAVSSSEGASPHYAEALLPWRGKERSDGLYVFVHGLCGVPFCWEHYRRVIKQIKPQAHCFIPDVWKVGNCPLEESAAPILAAVNHYAKKFPGKPINLVGLSNGGRIVGWLERSLQLEGTPIKVVSIAGVHFGTKVIGYFSGPLGKRAIKQLTGYCDEIQKDLIFGGASARRNLDLWRAAAAMGHSRATQRYFYASTEDELVRSTAAALPKISEIDSYRIVHGHSHTSIVEGVRDQVLKDLLSPDFC